MAQAEHPRRWHREYLMVLGGMALFFVFALIIDRPADIWQGYLRILSSRSTVGTDYITTGGMGAATVNAALVGLCATGLMVACGAKPNGAITMALWMTVGFGFFGVTPLNMAPVTAGVWLYSRFQKEPFLNFSLTALLACTLSPIASDIANTGRFPTLGLNIVSGTVAGLVAGFFLPIIAAATTRVHSGYNLYNIGFAGGIIAVFMSAVRQSTAYYPPIEVNPAAGNNLPFAIFLYAVMLYWMACFLVQPHRAEMLAGLKKILSHSGRLVTDYVLLYDGAAGINMGLLGILGTTITLLLGGELNGSALAGIFSMMAFGAFGKHIANCLPVMGGAILMAVINLTPLSDPGNICAILFSTGLAPIAGQYGIVWGIVAGMLHMSIVAFTGTITGGVNLFNNGFAAGFVALVLVPVILAFRRGKSSREA